MGASRSHRLGAADAGRELHGGALGCGVELVVEDGEQRAVPIEGAVALAEPGVADHELAVGILAQRIERDQALQHGDGGGGIAGVEADGGEGGERVVVTPAQVGLVLDVPVTRRFAGEQVPAIELDGARQAFGVAAGGVQLALEHRGVEPQPGRRSDAVAIVLEHAVPLPITYESTGTFVEAPSTGELTFTPSEAGSSFTGSWVEAGVELTWQPDVRTEGASILLFTATPSPVAPGGEAE